MLSKWVLVYLLAFGVQDISAGIDNLIDMPKFNKTLYDPHTQVKGALESIPVNCNYEGLTYNCCFKASVDSKLVRQNNNICTNFTYNLEGLSLQVKVTMNEKEIITRTISSQNPSPICIPTFSVLPVLSCVHFKDVYIFDKNLHTCIDFDMKFLSKKISNYHLNCVKFGTDGINLIQTEDSSNVSQAEELAENMSELNGMEIYDPVNFEPSEFPNDHTSSTTLEEDDNIGQLKL